MIFFRTRIGESFRHQQGLFADEEIPAASTVGIMTIGAKMTSERGYQQAQTQKDDTAIQTGTRWFGGYFMYDETWMHEDFINHSFAANTILLAGVLISRRAIAAGEEITCDYRFVLAEHDEHRFIDSETGRVVDGLSAHASVVEACASLLSLLHDHPLDGGVEVDHRVQALAGGRIANIVERTA